MYEFARVRVSMNNKKSIERKGRYCFGGRRCFACWRRCWWEMSRSRLMQQTRRAGGCYEGDLDGGGKRTEREEREKREEGRGKTE
jgi:hypothetical protein